MDTNSQRPKAWGGTLSSLNVAIETLNLAKEIAGITPAKAAFGSVSILLTMVRDSMVNEQEYVELGLSCADICRALDRGMNGKKLDDLSQSVCEAISQLTTTVAEIQRKVIKRSGQNAVSRLLHAKNDKETIAAWKLDLNRILHVFNTELVMSTHVTVSDIRHDVSKIREEIDDQARSTQASIPPGELPPPPPKACFGRDELIKNIVNLTENSTPVALIAAGGIGKTSIALAVLHNNRVRERFGEHRRFIRCDQFPTSRANFLSRLSEVIGAGVENPKDLIPLRQCLSSNKMFIVLDNAESILDPHGINAQEIYAVVEELSQFNNICLCITSRITTVPRHCKRPVIPTLSMEAACDIFYGIYDDSGRSDIISDLLQRLDFHALSITLLATTTSHNMWDYDRLAREWDTRRTQVLRTDYNESLAATIELSLASPMFRELGPDARNLLGVIAFFPQGVDENNVDWLFPSISDRRNIFDKICILSLTYRRNGFITMLAPLRDYLGPKDPGSFPLLCATKKHYFSRLSVGVVPGKPGFEEARWIKSEDVNVEHLLDIFTSIDANSDDAWDACANFADHLVWHKPRLTVLGPKIEGLADDHPPKSQCLYRLAQLSNPIGNHVERKRLLTHALELESERGNDCRVARTLRSLSDANRVLGLRKEGIKQGKEALEIFERLGDAARQVECLLLLAWLLWEDKQLDAAEEAASRTIDLVLGKDEQYLVCESHRILGYIYHSKGEREKAIHHFEAALGIASSFSWHSLLFWVHYALANLFFDEVRLHDAHTHVERARSHTVGNAYYLGRAMELRATIWYDQHQFEDAKSEVLRAAVAYEKAGAARNVEGCREFLRDVQKELNSPAALDF